VPFSLERMVFFSDAVFAIAITLLAIEIRLPEGVSDADVNDAIRDLLPMLFSYALSFAVIGVYWRAHWRRYALVARTDERLAVLNLVHLAFIALIPFPTAMLGRHGDQPGPVLVYALVVAAAGIMGTVSWRYTERAGLMRRDAAPEAIRTESIRLLAPWVVFVGSLPLIAVSPLLAEMSWILAFPLQTLAIRRYLATQVTPPNAPRER